MISNLIKLRNKTIRVFGTKIILMHKNNEIINNKYIMYLSSFIFKINYQEILFINKINYLYKLDNIYFYEDYTNSNIIISPIIISATVEINNNNINILDKLIQYNLSVPLFIFLYNEQINNINNINFKILKLGKFIDIIINYNNITKYKKIHELLLSM